MRLSAGGPRVLGAAPARPTFSGRHAQLGRRQHGVRLRVAVEDAVGAGARVEGDDYYAILGLDPGATTQEVKKAYRQAMKDYHPDQSDDEDYTEFAAFINQVYETLMDPDSRAEYDAISGFAVGGRNPFTDTSGQYAPDYAFVDEFACIGCRNCNNVCPKTFMMEEEHGRARAARQGVDSVDKLQEAIDTCPVSCIHWVTAPQLTLLEDAMGKMERVGAWLLRSNGGKGANLSVFFEASIAWEKRQSELKAREQRALWAWAPFAPAAGSSAQGSMRRGAAEAGAGAAESDDTSQGARPGKRVSAESMAAAARRWRDFQRAKRAKSQRLLSG